MSVSNNQDRGSAGTVQWLIAGLIIGVLMTTAGCSNARSAPNPPDPPTVEVAEVVQQDVPIYSEWIGTLDGLVNADIKAQVSGYLLEQTYTEGTFVERASCSSRSIPGLSGGVGPGARQLAQATGNWRRPRRNSARREAQVAVAEANQGRTQLDVDRYMPLAKQQAITQQDLDNATQNNMAAKAQIQAAKAAVETAKAQIQAARRRGAVRQGRGRDAPSINLGFTRLTSPIDGMPGIAQQQVGALVSPASGPVTTVSTVDPIKVYFTASEQEYLEFARRFPTAEPAAGRNADRLELELILADGITYPHKGRFYFADRQVDVRTGAIRLAGLFPNPGNSLRPGPVWPGSTPTRTQPGALLVPQQAVIDLQGTHQVAVVDSTNKVSDPHREARRDGRPRLDHRAKASSRASGCCRGRCRRFGQGVEVNPEATRIGAAR